MFIVLRLHRESFRQMMQHSDGRVDHSIKLQVLQMLKPQVCGDADHGDIKDFLVLIICKPIVIFKTEKKA